MTTYSFDVESFPNLFSATFFNVDSDTTPKDVSKKFGMRHKDVKTFVIAKQFGIDDAWQLEEFLNREGLELVGFNNKFYDSPVMDFVITEKADAEEIFEFSSGMIARERGDGGTRYQRLNEWKEIDLMKMLAFDKLGVSLKQASINLRWHRVQDLPFPYNYYLKSEEDIKTVLDYNLNDVLITTELYNLLKPELDLRRELSKEYGLDLMSSSDSNMGNRILNSIYAKESKLEESDFINLRTKRKMVWLRNCIGKNISFKTKKLRDLRRKIANTVLVSENGFKYEETIKFGNCEFQVGSGGLHSVDRAAKFHTDDEYVIMDADVASYYPNIMITNNIVPKHLDDTYIKILKKITAERIKAKKSKNKTKADGLKITINSIFGKLNSEYYWLEDAQGMLSVTISGQLYLLMLVEDLLLNGILTVSGNTDGIVCRIPRNLMDKYYEVCKGWEEKTGFSLEYTEYSHYIRTDVNNYITVKSNGETKEKGRYVQGINIKKAYKYPIVPQAMFNYFVNGVPVSETIRNCKDILDFCISQKVGSNFSPELHDGDEVTSLQKNNRFFVSNEGGSFIKREKSSTKTIGLFVGESVTILNDYDEEIPVEEYDINYGFYEKEAQKYIDDVEASTFNLDFVSEEVVDENEEEYPYVEINEDAEIRPAKFRYSGGTYRYDEKEKVIYRGLATINYITDETGENLYALRDRQFDNFLDFLIYNEKNSLLNSRQMDILITINFFSEFGKNRKLIQFYHEFKRGKNRYSNKLKDKTKELRITNLLSLWESLPNKSLGTKEQIQNELSILGHIQSRFDVDSHIIYVMDLNLNYSPKVKAYSLRSGKVGEVKVNKRLFNTTVSQDGFPMDIGDFVRWNRIEKKPAVRKEGDQWIEIPDTYNFWLESFEIL